jgi:multiple antibiotic resistance protein
MTFGLSDLLRTTLITVGALFPIVNPLGNVPIFYSLTRGSSSQERELLARKIALNGLMLLIGSTLIGTHILDFFGISLPVVQVGGGMVVIATGWNLLQQKDDDVDDAGPGRTISDAELTRQAFYPLTLPLTVGPGSLSVAITLGANWAERTHASLSVLLSAVIGPTLIAATIYLSYRFAERLARMLGDTAMNVIIRLSAFILLCIGVQILSNGILAIVHSAR